MAKKTAAQKKADKAFIEKIGTIGISTGASKKCPDCGNDLQPVGYLQGEVNGQQLSGHVYGHPGMPPRRRREDRPVERTDEQSFSA
jgi:hypothetical protein